MSAKRSKSFKDRLAAAKLPERTVPICFRADLMAEHEELERQLQQARQSTIPRMLAEMPEEMRIAEQITALEARMAEETEVFRVRALPRHEWNALTDKYPPPDGDAEAKVMGADFEPLMDEAVRLCVVEPVMDEDDWVKFAEVMTSRMFDLLSGAVWAVNRGESDVPKSLLASRVIRQHSVEQTQPAPTD